MESRNQDHSPLSLANRAVHLKAKQPEPAEAATPASPFIVVEKYLDSRQAWAMHALLVLNGGDPSLGLN